MTPPSAENDTLNGRISNQQSSGVEEEEIPPEFECAICMKLLIQPVSTPCGHTFCRRCISKSYSYRAACPICRNPISIGGQPNILLSGIIEARYPLATYKRKKELQDARLEIERDGIQSRLPLITSCGRIPPSSSSSSSSSLSPTGVIIPLIFRLGMYPIVPKEILEMSIDDPDECRLIDEVLVGSKKFVVIFHRRLKRPPLSTLLSDRPPPSPSSSSISPTSQSKRIVDGRRLPPLTSRERGASDCHSAINEEGEGKVVKSDGEDESIKDDGVYIDGDNDSCCDCPRRIYYPSCYNRSDINSKNDDDNNNDSGVSNGDLNQSSSSSSPTTTTTAIPNDIICPERSIYYGIVVKIVNCYIHSLSANQPESPTPPPYGRSPSTFSTSSSRDVYTSYVDGTAIHLPVGYTGEMGEEGESERRGNVRLSLITEGLFRCRFRCKDFVLSSSSPLTLSTPTALITPFFDEPIPPPSLSPSPSNLRSRGEEEGNEERPTADSDGRARSDSGGGENCRGSNDVSAASQEGVRLLESPLALRQEREVVGGKRDSDYRDERDETHDLLIKAFDKLKIKFQLLGQAGQALFTIKFGVLPDLVDSELLSSSDFESLSFYLSRVVCPPLNVKLHWFMLTETKERLVCINMFFEKSGPFKQVLAIGNQLGRAGVVDTLFCLGLNPSNWACIMVIAVALCIARLLAES